jgi:hypothetical protein
MLFITLVSNTKWRKKYAIIFFEAYMYILLDLSQIYGLMGKKNILDGWIGM